MPQDLETARADLRRRTAYLADGRAALDNLVWFKTQSDDRIVHRADANEYDSEYCTYSNSQGTPLPLDAPLAPPPAALSAIVRLGHCRYYLTACGDWDPNRSARVRPFRETRPSAIAQDPRIRPLAGDFDVAWDVLDTLVREIVPDDDEVMQSRGIIDRGRNSYDGFKIGHRVFERKGPEGDEDDDDLDPDPALDIANWPLAFPSARPYLGSIIDTHVAKPIPAYNLAGHLIPPSRYAAELKGAIVRLEFNVKHWIINRQHVFAADITRIRVLVPPPPPDTPTRRKRIPKEDDFYDDDNGMPPTPTKKARV